MPTFRHRVRTADALAALYASGFLAWLAIRPRGTSGTSLIESLAFFPLGLLVAWSCWDVSRLARLDDRTRAAWRLLAASALLLCATGIAWAVAAAVSGTMLGPRWQDLLRLGHGFAVVAAVILFPGRTREGPRRVRFVLDAGLVFVAGSVLAVHYGIRLSLETVRGDVLRQTALGPGLDLVTFVVAAIASIRVRDRGTHAAVVCMALAAAADLVATYYYTLERNAAGGFAYRLDDVVDALWFGAWGLRWLAPRLARGRYLSEADAPASGPVPSAPDERLSFSYLAVGVVLSLLTGEVLAARVPAKGQVDFLPALASSVALMLTLLLVRQLIELRENGRLFGEQLRQEARFRSFVQNSSDVVFIVDADGCISYVSPSASRVLGHDVLRIGTRLLDVVADEQRDAVRSRLAVGPGPGRLQLRLPRSDGSWREMEAVWTDLRGDPAVGGMVVNCRDVTERTELERRLRHSQKLDAVAHLAGGLAHDLNNVLAVISGYTELVQNDVDSASPAAEDLAHVRQAVQRAAAITSKVLAFSRRQPVLRTAVDVTAVVGRMLPLLRQTVGPRVEVRLALAEDVWPVQADAGQIEQVFVNLAANARDAMPEGGVLDVSTANRPGGVDGPNGGEWLAGDCVTVEVRDNGVGMSAEVKARIFEPFFSTKGGRGVGLGLAMVQGIVADSGGRVRVESEPGRGTCFTLAFPRTAAVPVHVDAALHPHEGPRRTVDVLLVDDEQAVRTVTRRLLEQHGCRVREAADGNAALLVLADRSIALDVLLTDLVMPGMHGREVVAAAARLRPGLPVVCMTGFAGERDDAAQYGGRIAALLPKPFSASDLARAIARATSERSAS